MLCPLKKRIWDEQTSRGEKYRDEQFVECDKEACAFYVIDAIYKQEDFKANDGVISSRRIEPPEIDKILSEGCAINLIAKRIR